VQDERYDDEWAIQCSIKVCDHASKVAKTKQLSTMIRVSHRYGFTHGASKTGTAGMGT
jgi:hypothetical protein